MIGAESKIAIPDGVRCFVDANIFYHCFVESPTETPRCRELIARAEDGAIEAVTNHRSLSDAVHKAMLVEVGHRFNRPRGRLVGWIKKHPEALRELPDTAEVGQRISELRTTVLHRPVSMLPTIIANAQEHQLLMGDAEIVTLMQAHGIRHIATNDDDFDRVSGVTVWKPRRSE